MSAGRMPVDHDALAEALPQEQAGRAHLLDDLARSTTCGHEIVARDRDGDAVRVQAARQMAEARGLERAPVAAVNEQRERRRLGVAFGWNRSMILPLARAVREAELGAAFLRPSRRDRPRASRCQRAKICRMLRHPRAIVVFGLVVDRHAASPAGLSRREIAAMAAADNARASDQRLICARSVSSTARSKELPRLGRAASCAARRRSWSRFFTRSVMRSFSVLRSPICLSIAAWRSRRLHGCAARPASSSSLTARASAGRRATSATRSPSPVTASAAPRPAPRLFR